MKFLFFLISLLCITAVFAANDPGHDSLYVLLTGESNVSGDINVTGNVTAKHIRYATLLYGDQLDVRANGSIFSVSSRPAIQADASDLYLDSTGNVYIATRGGTTGVLQVGPTSGQSMTLNVSGSGFVNNSQICTPDNGLCGAGGSNVSGTGIADTISLWTGTTELGNSVITQDTGNIVVSGDLNVSAGQDICITGGVCLSSGGGGGGGWLNTSTLVYLANNATNVSAGNTTNNKPLFFLDSTNERIGIGTERPTSVLHIQNPSPNITIDGNNSGNAGISFYNIQGGVNADIAFSANAGSATSKIRLSNQGGGSRSQIVFYTKPASSAEDERLRIDENGNVGINMLPEERLHVNGSINVTENSDVCITGGNCLSSVNASGGGWTDNNGIVNLTDVDDNVSIGATPTLFVDNENGRVGIGTVTPIEAFTLGQTQALSGIFLNGTDNGRIYIEDLSMLLDSSGGDPEINITNGIVTAAKNGQFVVDSSTDPGVILGQSGFGYFTIGGAGGSQIRDANADLTFDSDSGEIDTATGDNLSVDGSVLYVDATNNRVGVGTTSPTQPLVVQASNNADGVVLLNASDDNSAVLTFESGNNGYAHIFYEDDTDGLWIDTDEVIVSNGAEFFIQNDTGYIGIGTTNPGNDMHFYTATDGLNLMLETSASAGANLRLDSNRTLAEENIGSLAGTWDGTVVAHVRFLSGDDTTNKDNAHIVFRTAEAGTPSERMRITDLGNVGIGTTTPNALLHVLKNGTSYVPSFPTTLLVQQNGEVDDFALIHLISGNNSNGQLIFGTAQEEFNGRVLYNHPTDSMRFHTNNSERMRIDVNGSVGIGASDPLGTLHVASANTGIDPVGWADDLVVENGGAGGISIFTPDINNGHIIFGTPTLNDTAVIKAGDPSDPFILFALNGTGNERMRITNSGTLSIGSNEAPPATSRLHVDEGNVTMNSTYSMCFNENCSARIFHNGSALVIEGS